MDIITISATDTDSHRALEAVLRAHGLAGRCRIVEADGDIDLQDFPAPVRVGAILDVINTKINAARASKTYDIGPYTLEENALDLVGDDATVRLTEKERDILVFLAGRDAPVSRADMLAHVWEYAETVETHTLETHMYRLRQKIEGDPANPKILITNDDGYYLG